MNAIGYAILVFVIVILGLNYSIYFHDQRQEARRYLICVTKNNTDRWEGRCFPIWLDFSSYGK